MPSKRTDRKKYGHSALANAFSGDSFLGPLHRAEELGKELLAEFEKYKAADLKKIRRLIKQGANLNIKSDNKKTALMFAAEAGYGDVVQMLADRRTLVNFCDDRKMTALHFAAAGGHVKAAEVILEYFGNPDLRNKEGLTALHLAARGGHPEVMEALLSNEADINALDPKNRSPLFHAADDLLNPIGKGSPKYKAVELLIGHGAELSQRDSDGYDLLCVCAHPAVVRLLLGHDVASDSLICAIDYRNPRLHSASSGAEREIADMLRDELRRRGAMAPSENARTANEAADATRKPQQVTFLQPVHPKKNGRRPS